MKKTVLLFTALFFLFVICGVSFAADTLQNVKKRGVLRAGVKDLTPGFALADVKTGEISGYDVDIVKALARKLDARLEIVPIKEDERISSLTEGKVDIVAATMTKTKERERFIDFSHTYFVTEQKFLVSKGTVQRLTDLENKKVGTVAQTTSEINVRKALPAAHIIIFDDYVPAFLALQKGDIFAVTTDEAMLAAILSKADKGVFEIPPLAISKEPYGLGIRKDQKPFLRFINKSLLEMEKSGEAKKIYDKWFGPESQIPLKRAFKISSN
ncbi:MAG: ABC transporter glutamine-binding protein GlnH precursor [Smithella sp. PtaU1.Bin162]|nr:MAG: ABC transporter glutamine-binding protein GlnH precursor [Smithella sp. PtaU1.Bin162]